MLNGAGSLLHAIGVLNNTAGSLSFAMRNPSLQMRQKIDGIQGVVPKASAPAVEESDDEEEVIDGWTHVSGVPSPSGVESAPGWF